MNKASTLLVDSDHNRRAQMVHSLYAGGCVIEPLESCEEISIKHNQPLVILVHDEGLNLQRTIEWVKKCSSFAGFIAYAQKPTAAQVVAALRAGVSDYLDWPTSPNDIRQAIEACFEAKLNEFDECEHSNLARKRIQRLTAREREILDYMAKGGSSRLIGDKLGISRRTVEIHRAHILSKMEAANAPDAVRIAIEAGLKP